MKIIGLSFILPNNIQTGDDLWEYSLKMIPVNNKRIPDNNLKIECINRVIKDAGIKEGTIGMFQYVDTNYKTKLYKTSGLSFLSDLKIVKEALNECDYFLLEADYKDFDENKVIVPFDKKLSGSAPGQFVGAMILTKNAEDFYGIISDNILDNVSIVDIDCHGTVDDILLGNKVWDTYNKKVIVTSGNHIFGSQDYFTGFVQIIRMIEFLKHNFIPAHPYSNKINKKLNKSLRYEGYQINVNHKNKCAVCLNNYDSVSVFTGNKKLIFDKIDLEMNYQFVDLDIDDGLDDNQIIENILNDIISKIEDDNISIDESDIEDDSFSNDDDFIIVSKNEMILLDNSSVSDNEENDYINYKDIINKMNKNTNQDDNNFLHFCNKISLFLKKPIMPYDIIYYDDIKNIKDIFNNINTKSIPVSFTVRELFDLVHNDYDNNSNYDNVVESRLDNEIEFTRSKLSKAAKILYKVGTSYGAFKMSKKNVLAVPLLAKTEEYINEKIQNRRHNMPFQKSYFDGTTNFKSKMGNHTLELDKSLLPWDKSRNILFSLHPLGDETIIMALPSHVREIITFIHKHDISVRAMLNPDKFKIVGIRTGLSILGALPANKKGFDTSYENDNNMLFISGTECDKKKLIDRRKKGRNVIFVESVNIMCYRAIQYEVDLIPVYSFNLVFDKPRTFFGKRIVTKNMKLNKYDLKKLVTLYLDNIKELYDKHKTDIDPSNLIIL